MKNLVLVLLLFVTGYACLPPEVEFVNFRQNINASPEPGFVVKSGFVQTRTENYVIVGSTRDSQLLITNLSSQGDLRANAIADPATGHAMIPVGDSLEQYILLGNTTDDCFVQLTDSQGVVNGNRIFLRAVVNSQIGLVQYIKGFSIDAIPGGGYLISGRIRQSLGGERLFVVKLTDQLTFERIRTYNTGLYGTSLQAAQDGTFSMAGIAGNQAFIAVFNPDLSLVRQRVLSASSAQHYIGFAQNDAREWLIPMALENNSTQLLLAVYSSDLTSRREFDLNLGVSMTELHAYDITQVRDGGFLISGSGRRAPDTAMEAFLIKVGPNFALQWVEFYPGSQTTIPLGITQVKDYGFALLNFISDGTKNDYQLIKTDERGKTR
jgi:hypothetical protein